MQKTTLYLHIFLLFITVSAMADTTLLPPANDECAAATVLTVNSGQACSAVTTAVFTDATVSAEGNTCTATTGKDIWYQFVALSSAHNIQLSNFSGTAQPVIMVLYEGGTCGTMVQTGCSYNNVIIATGLTAGTTYKLRLYFNLTNPSLATTFSVCVNTPPPPADNNQSDCLITTINYDFENPPPPAPTIYPTFVNHNVVQGWRTTASDEMMEFWVSPNYESVPAYSGVQFIELNANLVSGVYQDYQTPQPTVFSYGFAHRGRQGTDTCQLMAGPPGGPYTTVTTATTGNTGWVYYTGTYTVPAGQTVTRFIFQSVSSVGGVSVGNFLDSITFSANNGILSENPMYLTCQGNSTAISSAGTGNWVAHADNPAVTTIVDPSGNNTTIHGLSSAGTYRYDWITQYCTSTLEIEFTGVMPPVPSVQNIVYCIGEEALPLTAGTEDGHTVTWFVNGEGVDYVPVPDTGAAGSTTYYVSQTSPEGCESDIAEIIVSVNTGEPAVTGFTMVEGVCQQITATLQPSPVAGFTPGGIFSAEDGLAIDPATGLIDVTASTPGAYTVEYTVTEDPENCIGAGSYSKSLIVHPAIADVAVAATHPGCNETEGELTVQEPLVLGNTYSLDGVIFQDEAVFSNLAPGSYTVSVQNPGGCVRDFGPFSINPAPALPAVPVAAIVHPGCTTTTGSITVTAPVGAGLSYSIDGINYQDGVLFDNLSPGSHTITVKNADDCTSSANFTVNPQPASPAVPALSVTHPSCSVPTGAITVTSPSGGGHTYSIDGTAFQASATFSALSPGSYTITVQNAAGCTTQSAPVTINNPPAVPATPVLSAMQPTCTVATGTITVTSPTGAGLTYSLDSGPPQASTVFANVGPGVHTVAVYNTDNCVASAAISIVASQGTPAVPVLTVLQPSCTVQSGTITVTSPTGAGMSYSINGTTFQPGTTFGGLAPGTYVVTVKNASGCIAQSAPVTINAVPAVPSVPSVALVQPTCTVSTGTVTVSSPVGAGLTYSIDGVNFQASPDFTGVVPGTYTVTVQNADNCTSSVNITINAIQGTPAQADVTVAQPDCDVATGTITVGSPIGGGLTYSINGVNFQPGTVFTNIQPGTYTITVKNYSGCTSVSLPVVVNNPPPPEDPGTITGSGAVCVGETLQLDNAVTGGTWESANPAVATVSSTGQVTAASAGTATITYTVTGAGCPATATATVTVHPLPAPSLETRYYICIDEEGVPSPVVLDSGLSAAYSFTWTKDNTALTATGSTILAYGPGEYTVTATSIATGCTATAGTVVIASSPATAYATVEKDFDLNQTVTVHVTGGTGDYEYSIDGSPFQGSPVFAGIHEGEYTITVRDKFGCGDTVLTVYALNYPRFFSPNGDGTNDTWNISGLRGREATVYIFDRYGKVISVVKPEGHGWDGTFNGAVLPATDYWFSFMYNASDGSRKEFKAHFSLIR